MRQFYPLQRFCTVTFGALSIRCFSHHRLQIVQAVLSSWTSDLIKTPYTVHCLKTQLKHYALKYTLKTQSLFKTLECLRLLCHPTCFDHTLDHLQGMFLVQCCFPPCCFVTILLGYVAVSSVCVVVMCTSLLSVLLCTQQDQQQRGTHDNNTDRRYGHIPK